MKGLFHTCFVLRECDTSRNRLRKKNEISFPLLHSFKLLLETKGYHNCTENVDVGSTGRDGFSS